MKKPRIPEKIKALESLDLSFGSQAGKVISGEYKKVVANWKHKVDFVAVIKKPKGGWVTIEVKPDGPPKHVQIWWWVYDGTKPHIIKPKTAGGLLVFRTRYNPKTTLTSYGGPGKAEGDLVFAKQVRHPGFKGRSKLIEKLIGKRKKELDKLYRDYVAKAMRA